MRTGLRAPLVAALAAAALASVPSGAQGRAGDPGALTLQADSGGTAHVSHRRDGSVRMVRATPGHPLARSQGRNRRDVAAAFAHRYGSALAPGHTAADLRIQPTNGSTVRFQQYLNGWPVVAGEAVVGLDAANDVTALSGALAPDRTLPAPVVSEAEARRTAEAYETRHTQVPAYAAPRGVWVYAPTLLGESGSAVRTVWRFTVSSGSERKDLLIDGGSGAIALAVDLDEGINSRICDGHDSRQSDTLPPCSSALAARDVGGPATGDTEIDAAHDYIDEAGDVWSTAGRNLPELIGTGASGSKLIEAWVRYCDASSACPFDNAYWDGTRIAFGHGYTAADDVVVHELTHGVIQHTANLMYLHQSGAINESIADIFGEFADQRFGTDDDSTWSLGENLPGGALRSMSDPTLHQQPDRIGSSLYGTGDASHDSGDVHTNSGIGNKTAWLIAHGGTFNNQTVASIDGTDRTHPQSVRLWSRTLEYLTSGSEYPDLADALDQSCADLLSSATEGFTQATCDAVHAATLATQLRDAPVAGSQAATVSNACPSGQFKKVLFQDNDGHPASWTRTGYEGTEPLWTQDPARVGLAPYVADGQVAWLGADPDPTSYGDDPTATLTSQAAVAIPAGAHTYLWFKHAYVLDYYNGTYYDGGRVQVLSSTGAPVSASLPWVNGPNRTLAPGAGGSGPAFSGDSRGWGSSRLELTALAGQSIKTRFGVYADSEVAMYGWSVDDIEVYSCGTTAPTAVRSLAAHGTASGTYLTWAPPVWPGSSPIDHYVVRRSDGLVRTYPASSAKAVYPTLPRAAQFTFRVQPFSGSLAGPAATVYATRTWVSLGLSATAVARGALVTFSSKIIRKDTGGALAGMTLVFQRRNPGSSTWTTFKTARSASNGALSFRAQVRATGGYRVVFGGSGRWVGQATPARRITAR